VKRLIRPGQQDTDDAEDRDRGVGHDHTGPSQLLGDDRRDGGHDGGGHEPPGIHPAADGRHMGAADIGGDRPGERLRESRSAERDAQPDHADEHVIVRTHLDAGGAEDADGVRAVVDHAAVRVIAVVTIADDVEAARWVVRAADWDPRVYAAVSE
jgi:hypothetical protein